MLATLLLIVLVLIAAVTDATRREIYNWTTYPGILAGLMLLELLATEKTSINKLIAKLEKEFGPHRYARIDTHFPVEKRAALMEFCKTNPPAKLLKSPLAEVKSYDGVKFISRDGSWLMLRGSGTEPILRIYAEAATDAGARKLVQLGVRMTQKV